MTSWASAVVPRKQHQVMSSLKDYVPFPPRWMPPGSRPAKRRWPRRRSERAPRTTALGRGATGETAVRAAHVKAYDDREHALFVRNFYASTLCPVVMPFGGIRAEAHMLFASCDVFA